MTVRKAELRLCGDRTPKYVDRETGAAELCISPTTWDEWVRDGVLPPADPRFRIPRWKWADVEHWLAGDKGEVIDLAGLRERSRRAAEAGR